MRKLLFLLSALLAFSAAVAATLGARGALNPDSLSKAPLVGGLVGPSKAGEHGEAEGHAAAEDGHGEAGGHAEEPPPAGEHPDGKQLEAAFELPRPYEAEELEKLVAELRAARRQHTERSQALRAQGEALERLAQELEERRGELEQLMAAVGEERVALDRDRATLAADRASFQAGEGEALKPVARAFEEMQPAAAAERLALFGDDRAAKVLALMRSRKAGRLLEALPPAQAAAVSSRLAAIRGTEGEEKP